MKCYFIVNPNSRGGKGLRLWNRARSYMTKRGIEYEIFFTDAPGDAAFIAKTLTEAVQEETVHVFVIGDDGTLNEVLNGLNHLSKVAVGFIPTAPVEGCARSLRLGPNPGRLLRAAGTNGQPGRIEAMDYGVLTCENGEIVRRFAGSSGSGFDAAISFRMNRFLNEGPRFFRSRRLLALKECVKELFVSRPVRGYLILDGERRVEFNNLMFVSVHIHPYERAFRFGSYADPKDGMLEICAVNCRNRLKLIPLLIKSRFRGLTDCSRVKLFQCREAHVHFDRPCIVHTDGETIRSQTDLDFSCIRQQLNIFR